MKALVSVWYYADGKWLVEGRMKDKKGRIGPPFFEFKRDEDVTGLLVRRYRRYSDRFGYPTKIVNELPESDDPFTYSRLVVSIHPDYYTQERYLNVIVRLGTYPKRELQLLLEPSGEVVEIDEPSDIEGLGNALGCLESAFKIWRHFSRAAEGAR